MVRDGRTDTIYDLPRAARPRCDLWSESELARAEEDFAIFPKHVSNLLIRGRWALRQEVVAASDEELLQTKRIGPKTVTCIRQSLHGRHASGEPYAPSPVPGRVAPDAEKSSACADGCPRRIASPVKDQ